MINPCSVVDSELFIPDNKIGSDLGNVPDPNPNPDPGYNKLSFSNKIASFCYSKNK
jgi:hypothetical protein